MPVEVICKDCKHFLDINQINLYYSRMWACLRKEAGNDPIYMISYQGKGLSIIDCPNYHKRGKWFKEKHYIYIDIRDDTLELVACGVAGVFLVGVISLLGLIVSKLF